MAPRDSVDVKQRIVGMIRRAGEISGNELFALIYQNHRIPPKRTVLKMHIYELRKAGYPIVTHAIGPSVYGWQPHKAFSAKPAAKDAA